MAKVERVDTEAGRFYNWCGYQLPSVTTILDTINKPGLLNWAVRVTAEAAVLEHGEWKALAESQPEVAVAVLSNRHKELRDQAANTGTTIHAGLEAALQGLTAPRPIAISLSEALAEIGAIDTVATEVTVINTTHQYAGTADAIVRCVPGYLLLDFKTGHAVYPEHKLQLAAYASCDLMLVGDLILPMPEPIVAGYIMKVDVGSDGDVRSIKPRRVELSVGLFDIFLAVLRLFRYLAAERENL